MSTTTGSDVAPRNEVSEACLDILKDYHHEDVLRFAEGFPKDSTSFRVDYRHVERSNKDLADAIIEDYDTVRRAFERALEWYDLPIDIDLSDATVRIHNLPEYREVEISALRSEHVGLFLPITGIVSRKSQVKSRIEELPFICDSCGDVRIMPQHGEQIQEPTECDCGSRVFVPINDDVTAIDAQTIELQEPPEVADDVNGSRITAELHHDLTGATIEGERITANAIVKVDTSGINTRGSADRDRSFYLEIQSIDKHETQFTDIDIDEGDIERLRELSNDPDIYSKLRRSLAPWITEHGKLETIKTAIILQLFGGVEHTLPNGDSLRGDIHVYLVGDAGTAKSQLGRAAKEIAPLGVYASGKGATPAGMTATATETNDGWQLDAGALVVANGGFAFVDEFDKMDSAVHQSLHEALENQEIPISKAGINTVLNAKTTVLAASNPKGGEINRFDSIAEQVDIQRPLLSRFDLVYLLYDDPDTEKDRDIATHQHDVADANAPDVELAIDVETLRKYIAYARDSIDPEYADESVKQSLVDIYVDMRQHNADTPDAPTPVTARVNDSLRRLAQASARARLSDTVTHEDVELVGQLLKESLGDTSFTRDGTMDASKAEGARVDTQGERYDWIRERLSGDGMGRSDLLDAAEADGLDTEKVGHAIQKMKQNGEVYNPKGEVLRST